MPILTIALFGVLELLLNNVMEPWLYGAHTGVSSIALIFAAVFWTWLWGPLGLVLATPLTVCRLVMDRHIPRLSFLSVVLSDEESLKPAEDCYQRMLTHGDHDEWELVEAYLKVHSLTELYDFVFLPVLIAAETDARLELLDPAQLTGIEQSIRELIEHLDTLLENRPGRWQAKRRLSPSNSRDLRPVAACICLPARAERDEIAGSMLVQLLSDAGFKAQNAPAKRGAGELGAAGGKSRC